MFNAQNVGERGGSRPFVVGLILLLLFLSTTQDWSSSPRSSSRKQLKETSSQDVAEQTKETIIANLIKSNEALEAENRELRLELFSMREKHKKRRWVKSDPVEEISREAPQMSTEVELASGVAENEMPLRSSVETERVTYNSASNSETARL